MRLSSIKVTVALFVGSYMALATPMLRDGLASAKRDYSVKQAGPILIKRDSILNTGDLTITSRQCDYTDPDGWGNQPQDWANYTATLNVMIPKMKSDLANQEKSSPNKPITYPIGTNTGGGYHWICSILPQGIYLQAGLYVCQKNYEPIWYMDLESLILIADTIVGNANNPCANRTVGVNGEVEGVYKTHSYYAYIIRWHDD